MDEKEKLQCGVKFDRKWNRDIEKLLYSLYPAITVV